MGNIENLAKPGIRNIPPYIPGDSAESARRPNVTEIFKLASNENQLGTSPKALQALREAVESASIYPDAFCMGLRTKLGRKFGFEQNPASHITISPGASGAIALIGEVFIQQGDEVVYCEPTFGAAASAARRHSGKQVSLPLTEDQMFDLDAIAAAVTDKTKIVYICNPNNPTGTVVDADKLRVLIHSLPAHVITVVDEAYIEFADDPERQSMISEIAENVNLIVLRTFSKLYGLAGTRIGYSLMNEEIHNVLQRSTSVFVVSREALAAASAAIDDEDFVKLTRKTIADGRAYLTAEFETLGGKVYNSQANFIYVDTGYDTAVLAEACKEKGLIIRGNFACSRVTIGTEYQNRRMMEIIKSVLAEGKVPKART